MSVEDRGDPKLWRFLLDVGQVRRLVIEADQAAMRSSIASGGGKVGENLTPAAAKRSAAYFHRKAKRKLEAARACIGEILKPERYR